MDDVFLKIVNLSISASWLILAVLVLRVVLKKAPKWVMPLLWGVVALRLVCLFSIESALSLIPSAETIPSEIVTETREPVLYEQATLDIVTNPTLPSAAEVPVGVSRQQAQVDEMRRLEVKKIPRDIDYAALGGLRLEAVFPVREL